MSQPSLAPPDPLGPSEQPAARLKGLVLDEGWTVSARLDRAPHKTGGCFSHSYLVTRGGVTAFLKAFDYAAALRHDDPPRAFYELSRLYLFERELLQRCAHMSRVVRAISHGKVVVDGSLIGTVQYLIFELARGDIRDHMAASDRIDAGWKLSMLHQVAVGLEQLHQAGIAHQDVKPSNILVFSTETSKVADLGCATSISEAGPFGDFPVAGDRSYAPPELLYGSINADWKVRRLGCDSYLLGSLLFFLFSGASANALLFFGVSPSRLPGTLTSFSEVLPELLRAFDEALQDLETELPVSIAKEVLEIARQLAHPDPQKRGDRSSGFVHADPFSMQRFITRFDLLAARASLDIRRL